MEKALRGPRGLRLTLREYIEHEGGQKNTSLWHIPPLCPACGQPVHAYDVEGALGIKLAGANLTHPHSVAQPGFHHRDGNANVDCPLYFRDDPRFEALAAFKFDARLRERISAVLFSTEIFTLNKGVMAKLWGALTGRPMGEEDRRRLGQTARRKLYNMEVLASYPWLLPYVLLGTEAPYEKKCKSGRTREVTFKREGEQKLLYKDFEGDQRVANVPMALRLNFANRTVKGKLVLVPMDYGRVRFPLTEWDSYILAGLPIPRREMNRASGGGVSAQQLRLEGCTPNLLPLPH